MNDPTLRSNLYHRSRIPRPQRLVFERDRRFNGGGAVAVAGERVVDDTSGLQLLFPNCVSSDFVF